MNSSTGKILCSTATPNASYPFRVQTCDSGERCSVGDVAGSPNGAMTALDAQSDAILWSREIYANASLGGGVSVHND